MDNQVILMANSKQTGDGLKKTKILIVEDERIMAEDLRSRLESMDYEVIGIAAAGADAIDLAEKNRPDLALMDIQIKGAMNGIETAQLLRDRFDVAFIYLTAYADRDTLDKVKPTAPHGFILKPFNTHELMGVLETALFKINLEKKLKEKASWLSSAVRSLGDGLIAVDPNGQILIMNSEAEALTGWGGDACRDASLSDILNLVDEVSGEPWVLPDMQSDAHLEAGLGVVALQLHPRRGPAVSVELSITPMIDEDGMAAGMVYIIRNVMKRREAEQALRDSEARYRRLYESITDAVAIINLEDRFVSCNDVFCEMLGYSRQEILLKTSYDITPAYWHDAMHERYYEEIEIKGYTDVYEKEFVKKNGVIIPVEIKAFLLRDRHGKPKSVWALIRDISARKANEIRLSHEKAFRKTVMHMATKFINLSLREVPTRLTETMQRLGEALDCGCCGIYHFEGDEDSLQPMHTWCNIPAGRQCLSSSALTILFREYYNSLHQGEMAEVQFADLNRLFAPRVEDDARQSTGQIYILPLLQDGGLTGGLVLQMIAMSHTWSEEEKDLLVVVVEMINSVLGRVKVESLLRIREDRYRNLFDHARDSISIMDEKRFLDCNEKTLELFGCSREELLGRSPVHFSPEYQLDGERSAEKAVRLIKLAYAGEPQSFEWTHRRASGALFEAEVSLSRVLLETGTFVQAFVRDISARKAAEQALRASEIRYRMLFEEVPLGLFRCDMEGQLLDINPAFLTVAGVDNRVRLIHSEIQALHVEERRYREWRDWLNQYGEVNGFEMRWHQAGDREIWVRLNAKFITDAQDGIPTIEGAIEEITERKQAEEALVESEERLAQILYGSVVATFVIDRSHSVTHWNRACENLTGVRENDVLGGTGQWKGFYEASRPTLADIVVEGAADETLIRHYGDHFQRSTVVPEAVTVESFFPHMGVQGKWLHFSAAPLFDRNGHLVGAIEIFSDITERRLAESLIQIQAELGIALSHASSLDEILHLCLEAALKISNMECGGIYLVDEQDGGLRLASYYGLSDVFVDRVSTIPPDSNTAQLVYQGESVFEGAEHFNVGAREAIFDEALKCVAILPVKDGEKVVACVNLASKRLEVLAGPVKQTLHSLVSQLGAVITRSRAQQALQRSESRLRLFLDASTDAYMIWDRHMRLTIFNQKALEHLLAGYSQQPLEGQSFLSIFPEAKSSGRYDAYLNVVATGTPFETEKVVHINTVGNDRIYNLRAFKMGEGMGLIATDVTDEKRMAHELRDSEERFRALSQNAQDTIMRFDREKRHLYVNPAVEQLTGISAEKFIGRRHRDLGFPESLVTRFSGVIDAVFETGEVQRTEFQFPNGTWVDCLVVPEWDAESRVQAVITSARDISGRKVIEQALKESEERFRLLSDLLPQPVYELDLDGRITYANQAAFQTFGYDESDFRRGVHNTDMIVPEQRGKLIASTEAMIQGETLPPREYTAQCRDGSTFPMIIYSNRIEKNNQTVGFRGIVLDITALRQAEGALAESEEKYRLLVERARDGIAIVSEGLIRFVNRPVCRMLHLEYEQIVGQALHQFIASEERHAASNEVRRLLQDQDASSSFELTLVGAGGVQLPVEINVGPYHYLGKEAVLIYIRDITERKRAQEAKRSARQAHHLASLGTLAAGISHEINQPLMALKVKVDSMLFWGEENPDILQNNLLKNLNFISSEADKIDQIIRHMRSLIRMETVRPKAEDINLVIDRAMQLISQRMASHGITLHRKYSRYLPAVLVHATSVEQVMINLLSNAMFALDRIDSEDKWVQVRTRKAGQYCIIEVSDNGPGVPEALQSKIFDPLFTTREKGEGMGLGLPIVQHLLMQINGKISVKNRPEQGAVFSISLPLAHGEKESV